MNERLKNHKHITTLTKNKIIEYVCSLRTGNAKLPIPFIQKEVNCTYRIPRENRELLKKFAETVFYGELRFIK